MFVYNEDQEKLTDKILCTPAIVAVHNDLIELGYINKNVYKDLFMLDRTVYSGNYEQLKQHFAFDERIGYYVPIQEIKPESSTPGNGGFPYSFTRNYEAIHSFNLFRDVQVIKETKEYWASKYLKNFSFGFEFETSCGYIPQMECFRNGLIPLRDGSISGLEYSTVVLRGNEGLNLLHQQLEQLKKHCTFNKECSLHIHVGGFPVRRQDIFNLYKVAKVFEKKIAPYMPKWTFSTRYYKETGKDYCKKLWDDVTSFENLFITIAEHRYGGSLFDVHPADADRQQKWRIASRYRWMNLVNMLCYDGPKTVEFRFLRPTFDETKIIFWLLLLTGIMQYAINIGKEDVDIDEELKNFTLRRFIDKIFEPSDAKQMKLFLKDLKNGVEQQTQIGDYYGDKIKLEDYSNLKI